MLEGSISKAAKVLDQVTVINKLSDKETFAKLQKLHPAAPCVFELPADATQTAIITTEELREAGRRLAKGAAPGPSGTTDGIVRLLLDDQICCTALCHMLLDVVNGAISKDVMDRLKRARLVAIPKANGRDVRPVAVGEIFLKLAEIVLLQKYEHCLPPIFAPWQFGVATKSGCETVVHRLHKLYQEGQSILTMDISNAFNTPWRQDIANALFAFSSLRPFWRLFHAQYAEPSELLYFRSLRMEI